MDPTLPINYLFVMMVAALLSNLITDEPRTALLSSIHRVGGQLRDAVTGKLPGLRSRSARTRGVATLALLLVARALLTTLVKLPF